MGHQQYCLEIRPRKIQEPRLCRLGVSPMVQCYRSALHRLDENCWSANLPQTLRRYQLWSPRWLYIRWKELSLHPLCRQHLPARRMDWQKEIRAVYVEQSRRQELLPWSRVHRGRMSLPHALGRVLRRLHVKEELECATNHDPKPWEAIAGRRRTPTAKARLIQYVLN